MGDINIRFRAKKNSNPMNPTVERTYSDRFYLIEEIPDKKEISSVKADQNWRFYKSGDIKNFVTRSNHKSFCVV